MITYLVRRTLWAAVLFLAVTVVTFVIFFIVPSDPAKAFAGRGAGPADVARATHYLGLDKSAPTQYGLFLKHLVVDHSLGRSFANRQDVNSLVAAAAPVTASLVFGGVVLWMMVALPIGILSAMRPRSVLDRISMIFVLIGISAHPLWIGLIFAYTFGYRLGWTPITGYCDMINPDTGCGGPLQWAYHLVLPWATFAVLYAALYVRMIRANVTETMNEDYVRTARAKGGSPWLVMRRHVLRNAMLPIVTMLGMDIGLALGGAIFTESIYSLPGLGRTTLTALSTFDTPTIMGIVVFATTAIIVFNLLVDMVYAAIDPRIRLV